MERHRYRLRFRKQGDLRWISHRDLLRTLERLFRRAGLRLAMSQGFHPKPRMTFVVALAVGIAGLDEVMELELAEAVPTERLRALLTEHAPAGLEFTSVIALGPGEPKAHARWMSFEIPLPADRQAAAAARIDELLSRSEYRVERTEGRRAVDIRQYIDELKITEGVLQLRLSVEQEGTARPREVLAALRLEDLEQSGLFLTRTRVGIETFTTTEHKQAGCAAALPDGMGADGVEPDGVELPVE